MLLRAAGFVVGAIDIDEAHFHVMAREIAHGALPYVDIVDKKPILTLLAYLPGALLGQSLVPTQLLGLLFTLATALAVGRATREMVPPGTDAVRPGTDPVRLGTAAAFLYAIASSAGPIWISAELLANLPIALALWAFAAAERREKFSLDFAAGLAVGAATLFRHQTAVVAAALALGIVASRRKPIARLALVGLGVALPWAIPIAIYARLGHLDAFIDWNFTRNFLYVQHAGSDGRFARLGGFLLLYVVLGTPVFWWLATRAFGRRRPAELTAMAALWLTWIPVSMSGRYYSQYALEFIPPLVIVTTPLLVQLLDGPRRRLWALALLLPLAIHQGAAWGRLFYAPNPYPCKQAAPRAIAAWLRANTRPDEAIFVWGYAPSIYYLAGRPAGARHLTCGPHVGDFDVNHLPAGFDVTPYLSARDIDDTIADLERRQTPVVVDAGASGIQEWTRWPLSTAPALARYVTEHYDRVAEVTGAGIYFRKGRNGRP